MQPSRALRRLVHELAKLWLNPIWKTCRIASRLICRRFRHHNREESVRLCMDVTF
jgi:hypothetical protein